MRRILLIGNRGQVGWELERSLVGLGEVRALDRTQLDLTDQDAVTRVFKENAPDLIINAAAYTDVESAESNEEAAYAVNAQAVRNLADLSKQSGAVLIHYSTDYIFDGMKNATYQEEDVTAPLSVYGRSKLAGEEAIRGASCAHLIIRTSWVYAARGRNFLRTMVRLASQRPELRIVNDQIGAPTPARFIAQGTALMARAVSIDPAARERVRAGTTVHLTASGETSWYGFAEMARALAPGCGVPFAARIVPISTEQYPTKARRPKNSRLSLDRLLDDWRIVAPHWEIGLRLCLEEIAEAKGAAMA